ncbi:MAG: leucine-rich repeat domain-containing protein [Bacteroidota bacterium]
MRRIIISIAIFLQLVSAHAQDLVSASDIAVYKQEAQQMVSFLSFVLNTLGNEETPTAHKQTIIQESYAKLFRDAEVQIEDDLVVGRSTITNKNVQAYLQDVDFFFEHVEFEYEIISIQEAKRADDQWFFLVETQRLLKGITSDGNAEIDHQSVRYIEINLYPASRSLKIASIYTTPVQRQPELITWWNDLSTDWQVLFAPQLQLNDTLSWADLIGKEEIPRIGDTLYFQQVYQAPSADEPNLVTSLQETAEVLESQQIQDNTPQLTQDTLATPTARLMSDLMQLSAVKELNLKDQPIEDLRALEGMPEIKKLNLSGTKIQSLFPLRNLRTLTYLDLSHTSIKDLEPLKYLTQLDTLILDHTPIQTLDPLVRSHTITYLSAAHTDLRFADALVELPALTHLDVRHTPLTRLPDLTEHTNLETFKADYSKLLSLPIFAKENKITTLSLNHTRISNIEPVSLLSELKTFEANFSLVQDIRPLQGLQKLQFVSLEDALLDEKELAQFMEQRPQVAVLYKTEQLITWWEGLDSSWKSCLTAHMQPNLPLQQRLHQLIRQAKLSLSPGCKVPNFHALTPFIQLEQLVADDAGIEKLEGIEELTQLRSLSIKRNQVIDLKPLASLPSLEILYLQQCPVIDLTPLAKCSSLRKLACDSTQVTDLSPLQDLSQMTWASFEGCELDKVQVKSWLDQKTDLTLLYRSSLLDSWWKGLSAPWQKVFRTYLPGENPSKEALHRLSYLSALEIVNINGLNNLKPLEPMLRLQKLTIRSCGLTQLQGVELHEDLQELDLSQNPLTDLILLTNLKGLTSLSLDNTAIEALEGIESLNKLERLSVAGTPIKKLNEVEPLLSLTYLDFSSTDVSQIKSIMEHYKLKMLKCFNTKISDRKVDQFRAKHPLCTVDYY